MATNAGTLEIVVTATTAGLTAGLANARDALNKAGPSLKRYGAILAGAVVGGLTASVYAFGEAQKSATMLSQALANQGISSRKALDELLALSSELQHLSGVSDEAVQGASAIILKFGATGEELKRLTRAAVDAAAVTGDLDGAAQALGKAFIGETSRLKQYGIVIDEATPKALRFGKAIAQWERIYGGAAAAKGKTFFGLLNIAKGDISNMAEEIGRQLVPVVQRFVQFMIDNRTVLMRAAGDVGRSILAWTDAFANVINWLRVNKNVTRGAMIAAGFGALIGTAGGPMGTIAGAAIGGAVGLGLGLKGSISSAEEGEAIIPPTRVRTEPTDLVPAGMGKAGGGGGEGRGEDPESFTAQWKLAFDNTFEAAKVMKENISLIMSGLVSAVSTGLNGFFTDMLIQGTSLVDAMKNLGLSLLNSVLGIIAQMIAKWIVAHLLSLVVKKSTDTAATGSVIANSIVQIAANKATALSAIRGYKATAMAAQQAAHAFIPFVGIKVGAIAAAAVGSLITGYGVAALLAEGGITTGPTLGLVGEAGPEAIIPLSKGKEMGLFGGGDGGDRGGVTEVHFHFDGATLVDGDETKWDNIARRYIIPALAAFQDKTRANDFRRWPARA